MDTNYATRMCQVFTDAWTVLRTGSARLPLPENVIILPLTELRGRPSHDEFGHFAPSRWRNREGGIHELAIHPGLFHSPEDVLLVLLHEAAHGLLLSQNLGCSGGGYYHRKEFRDECVLIGLRCEFANTSLGWNNTRWPETGVPEQYKDVLGFLRKRLALETAQAIRVPNEPGVLLPKSGRIRLECNCPRLVYATRRIALEGGIRCERCGGLFVSDPAPDRAGIG